MAVKDDTPRAKKSGDMKNRTCVLILGMHRSGTSALAGVLSKLGCELPATPMPESSNNAKGFFESIKVRDFNDELLASAGSSWDDFTPFHESWLHSPQAPDFLDRAATILDEEFGTASLFVLKDPRICRLFPFWATALQRYGCAVKPVLTIRNPLEVGNSLQTKKSYSEPFSQMIWLRHVLDAEAATRGMPRFHTSFEQLMLSWETLVETAQDSLGLTWPKPIASVEFDVQNFLSKDLRHHKAEPVRVVSSTLLPHWLRETYAILDKWAGSGETPSDYPALNRIKEEFDVASNAFARLVRAEREKGFEYRQRIEQLQSISAAAEGQRQALEKSFEDERKAFDQSLEEQKAEFENHVAALTADRAAGMAEREHLQAQLATLVGEAQEQKEAFERSLEELQVAIDAEREILHSELTKVTSNAELEIASLKSSRQDERRQKTLLQAELQQSREAQDLSEARLQAVREELAASQARRKEASRVIARRDAEIQKRYEELATLERHILRSSFSWRIRSFVRRSFGGKAYS